MHRGHIVSQLLFDLEQRKMIQFSRKLQFMAQP